MVTPVTLYGRTPDENDPSAGVSGQVRLCAAGMPVCPCGKQPQGAGGWEIAEMGESPRIDSLKTLGRYALIERVSDGYLGPVYRSFDQDLNRAVEILVFRDGIRWDPDFVELFRGECDAVARLRRDARSEPEPGSDQP